MEDRMETLMVLSLLWVVIASLLIGLGALQELSQGHVRTVVKQIVTSQGGR